MKKILVLVLLPVMAGLATPADAKVRLRFNAWGVPYFETYQPHRWRRAVPPPEVYGSSYYDGYGDPAFDESYYDPYYLPPSPRKRLKRLAVPQAQTVAPRAKTATATSGAKSSTAPAKKPLATASLAPASKSPATAGGLSCDKANKVVAGYGFSSVTAQDCEGQVYSFAATRDGKKFLIKVSAASGELTEVKKAD